MPIFFQHQINDSTRLGIWKIEEGEEFFLANVPLHRQVTHPHKRLQHLAGRFLLQFLFPDFPYELIRIADTRKPFLPGEEFHFSISHCGDFAAAIVSNTNRVGIDIEKPSSKTELIKHKFLTHEEQDFFNLNHSTVNIGLMTTLWSSKEAVFKWYGDGAVDFRKHIRLNHHPVDSEIIYCDFTKTNQQLEVHNRNFDQLVLAWVVTDKSEK